MWTVRDSYHDQLIPRALAHSVEGYYILQVQGAYEETARNRGRFRRKSDCGCGFIMYTCVRMLFILIYVLYKSKSLTLELWI